MNDKPKATQTLGLDITETELKGAQLVVQRRVPRLSRLFSIAKEPGQADSFNVKPLYKNKEEELLAALALDSLIVTAISSREVMVRPLDIHLTKERDIDAVLEFQAEPLLPYPLDESLVDRITVEKRKENTKLTVAAVKIDQITQHLELWHSIDIEPEVISCVPAALAAFSSKFHSTEKPHIHLNIGERETACALVDNGKLVASHTIMRGCSDWKEALAKDLRVSDAEALKKLSERGIEGLAQKEHPLLQHELSQFGLEATRIVYAYGKQIQDKGIEDILITGTGGSLSGIGQYLEHQLHQTVDAPSPLPEFPASVEDLQKYAVAIGLALTALPGAKDQINFRQKDFIYPNPWKRIKKPMIAYLSLCVALAVSLHFFGTANIAYKEDKLKKEYVNLLAFLKKPHSLFEKEIHGKGDPEDRLAEGDVPPVISLSQQDLRSRLDRLEKEVSATPDTFPLYPNIPKVSDVLAWLSVHPFIAGNGEDQNREGPRVQLESFGYKVVKRPEQGKQNEKYQAKVEIEFTSATPRDAREFHDSLLVPNDMVDLAGEVKWSAERGKYRASFFLKDKTAYPSLRK